MSDFDNLAAQPDSNSVDNGFEKVDPLNTPDAESAEDLVSSTMQDVPTGDLLSGSPETASPQLVDLGFSSYSATAAAPEPEPPTPEPEPIAPIPIPSMTEPQTQVTEEKKPEPAPITFPPVPLFSATSGMFKYILANLYNSHIK